MEKVIPPYPRELRYDTAIQLGFLTQLSLPVALLQECLDLWKLMRSDLDITPPLTPYIHAQAGQCQPPLFNALHQVSLQQFNKNWGRIQVTGTLQQMNITSKRLKKAAIPGEKPEQQFSPLRPYSNLSSQNPQIVQQPGEREDKKRKHTAKQYG